MPADNRNPSSASPIGSFQREIERCELEELWRNAAAGPKPTSVMSFDEMNAAKVRRTW